MMGIGAAPAATRVGELREIGVGMLGYAFMGKAHSNAFRKIAYMTWPPPLVPRLVAIAGRNEEAVRDAADRYGYERSTTDWHDLISDPAIGLLDNGGPNAVHAEPTILAAQAGKHVLCEKPLGRDADESYEIWTQVAATSVKHMCAFNYRFVPAVRLARELIDAGELGEIRHFRGRYLQDWGDDQSLDTWRFHPDEAGSGALGDLGAHAAPSGRSSRHAWRSAGGTRSSGRSTVRRARSPSTWNASTSCRSSAPTATARAASRPCSSPRPTTRSGNSGGRLGTSSAGATRS
jgi:hypothetical protein